MQQSQQTVTEEEMTNSTPETQDIAARRSFFGQLGGAAVLGLASLAPKRLFAQGQAPAARPEGRGSAAADNSAKCAQVRKTSDYQELLKRGDGHIGRVGYLSPGIATPLPDNVNALCAA